MLRALKTAVKGWLQGHRHRRRVAQLQEQVPHVTTAQLAADLRRLGVQPGDTLFIHSSLKSLGFVEGGPAAVIAALQAAVGSEGTLLLPTYYLPGGTIQGTCEMTDYVFDVRQHGSNMGALPNAFLAVPGVCRSVHPTHSVSALGRHAKWLTEAHHRALSVFGEGSPWQRFATLPAAKVLGLGVSMGPITFYHLVEDTMGASFPVDIWSERTYEMPSIDGQGQRWMVPVRPFKREVMPVRIDHSSRADLRDYMAAAFDQCGLRVCGRVGQAQSWTIRADDFLRKLIEMATKGVTIYSTSDQLQDCASTRRDRQV